MKRIGSGLGVAQNPDALIYKNGFLVRKVHADSDGKKSRFPLPSPVTCQPYLLHLTVDKSNHVCLNIAVQSLSSIQNHIWDIEWIFIFFLWSVSQRLEVREDGRRFMSC